MSFDDFKKMLIKPPVDNKTAEEILNSVEKMMEIVEQEGTLNGNI